MKNCILLILLISAPLAAGDREIQYGQQSGPGLLARPGQAALGPDGNVYAYDRGDDYFRVYRPDGTYLRRFGGPGQGPGEVRRRGSARFFFTRDGQSLVWTEGFQGNPWITIMGLDGQLREVLRLDLLEGGRAGLTGGVQTAGGDFLLGVVKLGTIRPEKQYFVYEMRHSLIRVDGRGRVQAELAVESYASRISLRDDGADLGLPFVPNYGWSLDDQEQIVFGDGRDRSLALYDLQGRKKGSRQLPLPPPRPVDAGLLAEWRTALKLRFQETSSGREWFANFGRVTELYTESIHPVQPCFSSFLLSAEGNLLIREYGELDTPEQAYIMVSPAGKELARIKIPALILEFASERLLYIRQDEDGDMMLCSRPRRGSEAADLAGL